MARIWLLFLFSMTLASLATVSRGASEASPPPNGDAVSLPSGASAAWDMKRAYSEKTPSRERICLNGLWRWRPAEDSEAVPAGGWGYFKVPGSWPGISDYLEKDCQTVFPHPSWKSANLSSVTSAWYQREIAIPGDWAGRRITIATSYLNSLAVVYADGRRVGEMRFPDGEVDLTKFCRPGTTHLLSLRVTALPLRAVMLSYADTNHARQEAGSVARRGLCGDVYLVGAPAGARISDARIATSTRRGEIAFDAELANLAPGTPYSLRAEVLEKGGVAHAFASSAFRASDLRGGRFRFVAKWMPKKLWDLNAPGNMLTARIMLAKPGGKLLDAALPVRFGYREFWIKGRDFYLNGTRIHLSAAQVVNAQVGAAWASYAGAKETFARFKSIGVNFVYGGNYDCEPGSHLSFDEILRAADDSGILVALTQPHFSAYDWDAPEADRNNGYARHAAFYVKVAENHPSVVAYAMSHNATGYVEDTNPDMIDGLSDQRDTWALNNVKKALRAEAIVERLDPTRIVYHHSSGNLGSMHTDNFYLNFAPIQELSDWFEHWATVGVKPLFLCEYAVPFSWDWTMYRGWYKGKREWGSAEAPWEFCQAEWSAQFVGDRAYRISEREKANIRWEAAQFRAGRLWHRWDYPTVVGDPVFDDMNEVIGSYIAANWRAYRTWGVSAIGPWDHEMYWRLRDGVDRRRVALPVDWKSLQRPGYSPDYLEDRPDDMVLSYSRSDWIPTAAGHALLRNDMPLLAYLAGKPSRFTSQDHNFRPGETVEKQLILINDSRGTVSADCRWTLELPEAVAGEKKVVVPTGEQVRIPLRFALPKSLAPGKIRLTATARFSDGETQSDSFVLNILTAPPALRVDAKIALYDPKGETARMLGAMGVSFQPVDATADLSPYDVLIVGKGALAADGPGPDLRRIRDGLKVLVMEQTSEALERRLGFRTEEYGLRQVFIRTPGHPALDGFDAESLRDWRGEATILPPRLKYEVGSLIAPTVKWCGIDVSRVWRCGCRGSVASVLIEKPARGDFLPLLDGGYSLQYSPLMEYREGSGMILFCQMDVTGRTEDDPAADRLARDLLQYASDWKPSPRRKAFYVGDPVGKECLEAAGFSLDDASGPLPTDAALIAGPGGGKRIGQDAALRDWIQAGGHLLAFGLDPEDADAIPPGTIKMKTGERIAAYFDAPPAGSWLTGVSPAELQNRDPRDMPLVSGGAEITGDGTLAKVEGANVALCQIAPWQFDPKKSMNLKRTYRRVAFLASRLVANMGVPATTPLIDRFAAPAAASETRWLNGLYLDIPEEWDDPYRFFGW